MNLDIQRQFDASPERCDITVIGFPEEPILEKGVPVGMRLMVEYAPAGTEDMTRIKATVEEVLNVEAIDDPDSTMHNCAKARAAAIQRALMHHKTAATTPEGHLGLESWAGLTPVMCAALRKAGVRSLQELVEASEPTIARMHVTNPRKLIEHCRMYLASMDKTRTTHELQQAREDNDALKAKIADMEAKFAEVLARLGMGDASEEDGDAPKRRGRRSNAEIAAERAAAEAEQQAAA